MDVDYLKHRRLEHTDLFPEPLRRLLDRTQECQDSGDILKGLSSIYDSLAYLTAIFSVFSVSALKLVGPYSRGLELLLDMPHSLDKAERLLAQSFADWKVHPHHPVGEALQEVFFLTSLLQSTRSAPRRHTRWLGIEGRAVAGLEQQERLSDRIDLVLSSHDEKGAVEQITLYLPILWIWTDASANFFRDWTVQITESTADGWLELKGSIVKDDARVQLVGGSKLVRLKTSSELSPTPDLSELMPAPDPVPAREPELFAVAPEPSLAPDLSELMPAPDPVSARGSELFEVAPKPEPAPDLVPAREPELFEVAPEPSLAPDLSELMPAPDPVPAREPEFFEVAPEPSLAPDLSELMPAPDPVPAREPEFVEPMPEPELFEVASESSPTSGPELFAVAPEPSLAPDLSELMPAPDPVPAREPEFFEVAPEPSPARDLSELMPAPDPVPAREPEFFEVAPEPELFEVASESLPASEPELFEPTPEPSAAMADVFSPTQASPPMPQEAQPSDFLLSISKSLEGSDFIRSLHPSEQGEDVTEEKQDPSELSIPVVAKLDPALSLSTSSLPLTEPGAPVSEMGGGAEEVLEDDFQFSAKLGPAKPNWKGWGSSERELVQKAAEDAVGYQPGKILTAFAKLVLGPIEGSLNKLSFILAEGCGKSYLARALSIREPHSEFGPLLYLDWAGFDELEQSIKLNKESGIELIFLYFNIRSEVKKRGLRVSLPEPEAVAALVATVAGGTLKPAFHRLMGQIGLLNSGGITFIFDEPPFSIRSCLTADLPPGLRIISLLTPLNSTPEFGTRISLQEYWLEAAEELYGVATAQLVKDPAANFLRASLCVQHLACGGALPSPIDGIEEVILNSKGFYRDLLVCLSLDDKPIAFDDLDQWYLLPELVAASLKKYPGFFSLEKGRLSHSLGVSHRSISRRISLLYADACASGAVKLLGWVLEQLEATPIDRYDKVQVREIVYRHFCQLYRYAQRSNDDEVVEWVVRNKKLQQQRVVLVTLLERHQSRWDLFILLSQLRPLLEQLVGTEKHEDLRDELAWLFSNQGLNKFYLGLHQEALEDLGKALELFSALVEKERQHEFRPALATSMYRLALVKKACGQMEEAKRYAGQAISEFTELVEDRGRSEYQPRLGVAFALRAKLSKAAGDQSGAIKDLLRALALVDSQDKSKQQEIGRTQVEILLDLGLLYLEENELDSSVKYCGRAVQQATERVEEEHLEELRPLLASCHTARARAYTKLNELDRAKRDLSKSISCRNLSIDEGRLEQRYELSGEYTLRSELQREQGTFDEALRDLGKAIELLSQLDDEGSEDGRERLLLCLIKRAEIEGLTGDTQAAISDLNKVIDIYSKADKPATLSDDTYLLALNELMTAYLLADLTGDALAVSDRLLKRYSEQEDWKGLARVQVARGDILLASLDYSRAGESLKHAVDLLSKLVGQHQTDDELELLGKAYLGLAKVELAVEGGASAYNISKQALDIFSHLYQQRGLKSVLNKVMVAYSLFAATSFEKGALQEAGANLKNAFDVLGYLEQDGSAAKVEHIDHIRAELHIRRARVLLAQANPGAALQDAEEASRHILQERNLHQHGPWKDELARLAILRSEIFMALKDFAQADQKIQEAIAHFEALVLEDKYQYFNDLMRAHAVRSDNFARIGKIDRVLEEYERMLRSISSASQNKAELSLDIELAKVIEKRARVYYGQRLLNEAFGDYERVIGIYRKLLGEKFSNELAINLLSTYLAKGEMLVDAGHHEHALGDFSHAIDLGRAMLSQGGWDAAPGLARGLQNRAASYKASGRSAEALQDLEVVIGLQMQMAQQHQDPELLGRLAKALLDQGLLLAELRKGGDALKSLDQSIDLFTQLVDGHGYRQYSSDLAQALISRVAWATDKADPAMRQVLIRAIELVAQRAREGVAISRDFPIDCLRTLVDLLGREGLEPLTELMDAILKMLESVVTDGNSYQDFVKITDLLLAASGVIEQDRHTSYRPHLLSLACVSCSREIQMFGQNSLPRLVYCLNELGVSLERAKPPAALTYIGGSFTLLAEIASRRQNSEDFIRELRMMINTWRSLPPQIPALANVSRQVLSHLLRLG